MENMEELHRELMISQKNDELTPAAKNMLVNYSNEVFEQWYDKSGKYGVIGKEKLLEGGMEFVFKYWKDFKCEKYQDPGPYFKEIFKRGLASHYYKNTKEYREKKFLDSLQTMGRKILMFNLPYEIELDGPTIRKFSYTDPDKK